MPAGIARIVSTHLDGQGISLRQAAAGTGIKLTTFHRRLHGVAPFTYPELVAIADLLGTTVAALAAQAEELAA